MYWRAISRARRVIGGKRIPKELRDFITGKETEPWEILYFKAYKSQSPVIEQALDRALAEQPKSRRPTLEEIHAATEEFRRMSGLDRAPYRPFTKADWDALWPTGIPEIDGA